MKYYSFNLGDYYCSTSHLSLLEHGVYRRLLDILYITNMPLPLSTAECQRLAGCRNQEDMEVVDSILQEYFTKTDKGWINKRAWEIISQMVSKDKNGKAIPINEGFPENSEAKPNSKKAKTKSASDREIDEEIKDGLRKLNQDYLSPDDPLYETWLVRREIAAKKAKEKAMKAKKSKNIPENNRLVDTNISVTNSENIKNIPQNNRLVDTNLGKKTSTKGVKTSKNASENDEKARAFASNFDAIYAENTEKNRLVDTNISVTNSKNINNISSFSSENNAIDTGNYQNNLEDTNINITDNNFEVDLDKILRTESFENAEIEGDADTINNWGETYTNSDIDVMQAMEETQIFLENTRDKKAKSEVNVISQESSLSGNTLSGDNRENSEKIGEIDTSNYRKKRGDSKKDEKYENAKNSPKNRLVDTNLGEKKENSPLTINHNTLTINQLTNNTLTNKTLTPKISSDEEIFYSIEKNISSSSSSSSFIENKNDKNNVNVNSKDNVKTLKIASSPPKNSIPVNAQPATDTEDGYDKDVAEQWFEEIWNIYPRNRDGKTLARRKFIKVVYKEKKINSKELLDKVTKFRKLTELEKTEKQFIPYLSTWINQERWRDFDDDAQDPAAKPKIYDDPMDKIFALAL